MDKSANTAPTPGTVDHLAPGLRRILAPNPSPMTFWGTNTYIVGQHSVAVIDPGPDLPDHLAAILDAVSAEQVSHILVTHSHLDHSPLAGPLAKATGAPVLAFGDALAGRSAAMQRLEGLVRGGEGVDLDFAPDQTLADDEVVTGPDWSLRAMHTPGHFGNHLCFAWNDTVFSGDHVMGWASSLVSPPDGDMGAYMASLDRLTQEQAIVLYPGHGAPITDPQARLAELTAHRQKREAQVIVALGAGPADAATLAARIYDDVAPVLLPAAARNVFAHLLDLWQRKIVTCDAPPNFATAFAIA